MEENFTIEATIPTCSYGNIHAKIEGKGGNFEEFRDSYMPEIETMFKRYSETPVKFSDGVFVKVETFTGETILYDTVNHKYKDLDGNELISATTYKKKFEKPFDLMKISEMVAKKHGVPAEVIRDMWEKNSKISTTFGSAIHYAMEQYWLHREHGCEDKEYYLPKHPLLRQAVDSFPDKEDREVLPELFVSNVSKKMVGQIDGLCVSQKEKVGVIMDYKTDADMKPDKLKLHFIQLSFYADILKAFGWNIEGLEIWNYTDKWTLHESPVLNLEDLETELAKKQTKK